MDRCLFRRIKPAMPLSTTTPCLYHTCLQRDEEINRGIIIATQSVLLLQLAHGGTSCRAMVAEALYNVNPVWFRHRSIAPVSFP